MLPTRYSGVVKLQGGSGTVGSRPEPNTTNLTREIVMPSKLTPERRAYQRRARKAAYVRNRAFVDEINTQTVCAHCGTQPIEWHNPEHVALNRQRFRICRMVRGRSIAAIQAEMARCTPLCRRCHMAEDGRLEAFARAPRGIGERNRHAQLTAENVMEIKRRLATGEAASAIARAFGVSHTTVSSIRLGKLWRHLLPAEGRLTALPDQCHKGHINWYVPAQGGRTCRDCQRDASRQRWENKRLGVSNG